MENIRIATILPIETEYSQHLLDGALDYCCEHEGVSLVEASFFRNAPPDFTGELPFDAALLWLNPRDRWAHRLVKRKVPMINTSAGWSHGEIPCLCYRGVDVFAPLTDHLRRQGYRDLLYLVYDKLSKKISVEIARQYEDYILRQGMTARVEAVGLPDSRWEDHELKFTPEMESKLKTIISSIDFPMGIICDNDYLGYHLCRIANDNGISIPQDLGVVGMCDYRIARICNPQLSSLPHGYELGWTGIRMLHEWLSGAHPPPLLTIMPPPSVICRESTGGGRAGLGRLQRVSQMILSEACEGITVAEIARRLSESPQTLTKMYKRAFGRTIGEDIRRQRVRVGKHCLKGTGHTVTEIAGICGFSEHSRFCNFFKRETGMTPLEYRRSDLSYPSLLSNDDSVGSPRKSPGRHGS